MLKRCENVLKLSETNHKPTRARTKSAHRERNGEAAMVRIEIINSREPLKRIVDARVGVP